MLVAMSASLVYLLLRQVLQMLTQLARDGGAKDVEILVLRHQVATSWGSTSSGAASGAQTSGTSTPSSPTDRSGN
jgi:hypothetical protein